MKCNWGFGRVEGFQMIDNSFLHKVLKLRAANIRKRMLKNHERQAISRFLASAHSYVCSRHVKAHIYTQRKYQFSAGSRFGHIHSVHSFFLTFKFRSQEKSLY